MKKVYIFDLDDTLYNETTYVYSGFLAVAKWFEQQLGIEAGEGLLYMKNHLEQFGRGTVFDALLKHYNLYSHKMVGQCLSIYRSHQPSIELYEDAVRCLERLKNSPIYIITDGNKNVQRNKLQALQLDSHISIRKSYITRRYGIKNEKPSPHCFLDICKTEQISPEQAVYVGDNPHKDFVGIRPLGFKTVRILRGSHECVRKPEPFEAESEIHSLDELDERFIQQLFNENL